MRGGGNLLRRDESTETLRGVLLRNPLHQIVRGKRGPNLTQAICGKNAKRGEDAEKEFKKFVAEGREERGEKN